MVLKEAASRKNLKYNGKRSVFFISMVASNRFGQRINEYFTFDIATKLEFENTNVVVLDCHDLLSFYIDKKKGSLPKHFDVYDMVEELIDSFPDGFHFVDECPFLTEDDAGE